VCGINGDPTAASHVDNDAHNGGLRPNILPLPLCRDPIPETVRGAPGRARYGYPLCFSEPGFEWHPYLPAVTSFHYPIFRGMTSAKIIRTGSGWKLRDEDILLWTSVEFVMLKVIQAVSFGQVVSIYHVTPDCPEVFGYKRLHTSEKFATKAKTASLNAFQRMLAYCSYTVAATTTREASSGSEGFQPPSLWNPEQMDHLFKRISADAPGTDVHVLVKFLWGTLHEIHRTSNFTGVLVHPHKHYDYPCLRTMRRHGVPVYIWWDNTLGSRTYSAHNQHHILNDWAPDFRALEHSAASIAGQSQTPAPSHYGHLRPIKSTQRFSDPMDYVQQRIRRIEDTLTTPDKAQSMKSRQESAMKFGIHSQRWGADVYQLERKEEIDQNTGKTVIYWERRRLDKADAGTTYDNASRKNLWCGLFLFLLALSSPEPLCRYDCEHNQWNFCEEFAFEYHGNSADSDSEEDVGEFFESLAMSGSEEGEGGTCLDDIFFSNDAVVKFLGTRDFKVSERDVASWRDALDFLTKRYGLTEFSDTEDMGKKKAWRKKLGLTTGQPDKSTVELYDAVRKGQWPPMICDLSADMVSIPDAFPSRIPGNVLVVNHAAEGYIVAIQDGKARPWKLLISDPLSVLQIERELWCSDGDGLVTNLVKKGIPFQVLHTWHRSGTPFFDSPGPVLHPTGVEPRLADYFAYRHDLVGFLQTYPHAHAAALCAGGIIWRTAVDVLPLPLENAIVGPFHRAACISRVINGDTYWTPRLTEKEEQLLVGVYRWAESKLPWDVGMFAEKFQVTPIVLGKIAGGRSVPIGLDPVLTLARGPPSTRSGIRRGVLTLPMERRAVFEEASGPSTLSTKERIPWPFFQMHVRSLSHS